MFPSEVCRSEKYPAEACLADIRIAQRRPRKVGHAEACSAEVLRRSGSLR
jgi:hypothetical protein